MVHRVYDREKLYKEIWKEPMTKVAKRYNISDTGLKKVCKKLNIPVPGVGYWAKVHAGKEVSKIPLPEQTESIPVKKIVDKSKKILNMAKRADNLSFLSEKHRKSIIEFCCSAIVSTELTDPHVLVKKMDRDFKSFRVDIPETQKVRILRLFNTLFKALEGLNYKIEIDAPYINIMLGQDKVQVYFYEAPNGFKLVIGEHYWKQKKWLDSAFDTVENHIGEIILSVIIMLNAEKVRREEYEIINREREKQFREEKIYKYKCEVEAKRISDLLLFAEDYFRAKKIYEYVNELENKMLIDGGGELDEKVKKYIKWAKQKADWYNPFVNREDELFGEKHKKLIDDLKFPADSWLGYDGEEWQ